MSAPRVSRGGIISGRSRPTSSTGPRGRGSARGFHSATPTEAMRGPGRGNAPTTNARLGGPPRALSMGTSNRREDRTVGRGSGSRRVTTKKDSSINNLHRGAISNSWAKRSAALKLNDNISYNDFTDVVEKRYVELKAKRATDRAQAIQHGMLADPDKKVTLDQAITPVGTCTEMCPEFERLERMKQMMVDSAEKLFNAEWDRDMPVEERMVKRFRRSAAGYDEQLPSDIRTPETLKATLDYLFDEVVGKAENFATVQKYVWDRTRSIRNDFSIQQVTEEKDVALAVECFERIARFHILSLHQLSNPAALVGGDYFDAHQEREQLNNTLLSLMYYYDDNRDRMDFKNEAEFRAYCIIFEIQSQHPDLEDRMQSWPEPLLRDKRVQTAFKLYCAAGNTLYDQGPLRPPTPFSIAEGNSTGFWRLLSSNAVSYLMACVAEIYFGQVRYVALQNIWKNVKSSPSTRQGTEEWTVGELTKSLAFDEDEQSIDFARGFDLDFKANAQGVQCLDFTCQSSAALEKSSVANKQIFSTRMVEKKRMNRTLPAVANGLSVTQAIREGLVIVDQEQSSDQETTVNTTKVQENDGSLFVPEREFSSTDPVKATKPSSIFNPQAAAFTPTPTPLGGFGHSSIANSIFGKPFTSTSSPISSAPIASSIFGKTFSLDPTTSASKTTFQNFNTQSSNQTSSTPSTSKSFKFGKPAQVLFPSDSGFFPNQSFNAPNTEGVYPRTVFNEVPKSSPPQQAQPLSEPFTSFPSISPILHLTKAHETAASEAEFIPSSHEQLAPAVAADLKNRDQTSNTTSSLFDRVDSALGASEKASFQNPFSNVDFTRAPQSSSIQNQSSLFNGDIAAPSASTTPATHTIFGTPSSDQGFPTSQPPSTPVDGAAENVAGDLTQISSSRDHNPFSSPTKIFSGQAALSQVPRTLGKSISLQESSSQSPSSHAYERTATRGVNGLSSKQVEEQSDAAGRDLMEIRGTQVAGSQQLLQWKAELKRFEQTMLQRQEEMKQQEQEVARRRSSFNESEMQLYKKNAEIEPLSQNISGMEQEVDHLRKANIEKESIMQQERKERRENNLRAQNEALKIKELEVKNAKFRAQRMRDELEKKQESKQAPITPAILEVMKERAVSNISRAAFLEECGIMQQFVEHSCRNLIKQAFEACRQEHELSKARPYREHLLKFKYSRRWRNIWWKRHLVRKGQQSRARMKRLRESMREEDRHTAMLEAQQKAIVEEAKMSEDIKRQIRENNEREEQEKQQARKAKRDAGRAVAEGIAMRAGYIVSQGKKRKFAGINDISKDDSWNTYDPLGRRPANSQRSSSKHSHISTMSMTLVRAAVGTSISRPRSASPTTSENTGVSGKPKDRRIPQGGWRHRQQDNRKNFDATETDYFRLKARGVDPETPFVPETKKMLERKKTRAEQQLHEVEFNRFASSFVKKSQDSCKSSITMPLTPESAASNRVSESMTQADKILEGLQQINAQLDKDIKDMRETNVELRKQRDAELQFRYSSNSRDFSSSPLSSSERSLTPGQMATVNGHAFMPGRSFTRSEARLRMTGGSGLAYRDPADFEEEIKQRYERAKQVLKGHKPLTMDDIDKKHGLGKYAPGYVRIGNESPEPSDPGDRSPDVEEPEAVTLGSPVLTEPSGRKRKRGAVAPPAAGRRKKRRSLDGTCVYESDSENETENWDERSITEANRELQYSPSHESIVQNVSTIDPALGVDAFFQKYEDGKADAEGEFDVDGEDEIGSDAGEHGKSGVYQEVVWDGEEEFYNEDGDGEQEDYEEELEDEEDSQMTDEEDAVDQSGDGAVGLRGRDEFGFGNGVGSEFTTGPGASQDDAIELSD